MEDSSIDNIQLRLRGFSGNKIEVLRLKNNTFVTTTSKSKNENQRINDEIKKLEQLLEISKKDELFKVPKILSKGINSNGLSYYELNFIPAESLDASLHKLSSQKIKEYAKKLGTIIELISSFSNPNRENKINEQDFLMKKFNETIQSFKGKKISMGITNQLFQEYENNIKKLSIENKHITNEVSFCHGDLALDNILITRNDEIYLIDPLANEYEHFMWDISKILQSSMTHWNLIKYNEFEVSDTRKITIKPHEHMFLFHKHFVENLKNYEPGKVILYLAATLARVTKYAKSEKQLCALILITNNLLDDYNDRRYDLSGSLSSLRW